MAAIALVEFRPLGAHPELQYYCISGVKRRTPANCSYIAIAPQQPRSQSPRPAHANFWRASKTNHQLKFKLGNFFMLNSIFLIF
jgi:hypothetical protein